MSFSLKNNFLTQSRGLSFEDTASVAWSFNASTNQITAVTGGGTVGSVALSDGSTAPIYTISGSPVTGTGTLTFALKTQSPNLVLAGPPSGAAAQPTFRALVVGDLPSGYPYGDVAGTPTIPSAANPSGSIGLAAVNGSAATFMRSDGAPALSVAITPTWTGAHSFTPGSGVVAITISASGGGSSLKFTPAEYTGIVLDLVDGWVAAGSGHEWKLGCSVTTPGPFQLYDVTRSALVLSISTTGATTLGGALGINNATPPGQVTGWGIPTGASLVANFPGASATLAQCSEVIAKLITDLKAFGLYGA